jgi:hypothetical protein
MTLEMFVTFTRLHLLLTLALGFLFQPTPRSVASLLIGLSYPTVLKTWQANRTRPSRAVSRHFDSLFWTMMMIREVAVHRAACFVGKRMECGRPEFNVCTQVSEQHPSTHAEHSGAAWVW